MQNLILRMKSGEIPAEPVLVISDNPAAGGIEKARALQIPVYVLDRKTFLSKESFEKEILRILNRNKPDFILLAGFMRILSQGFVRYYQGKIINIHPSLLPQFPGAHGIRDAWNAKVQETGVTIHYVDEGVDTGPIILQKKISITPEDTLETLEAKIHALEYEIYPMALKLILNAK